MNEREMNKEMKRLLPQGWAVPKRFHERLGDRAGRQRAMIDQGHLLLVLHEAPRPGVPEREARFFWRDAAGSWRSSDRGAGPGALRGHVQAFEDVVDALEARLKDAVAAEAMFAVLRAAVPLLRASRNLHQTLQAAREAVDDRELISLRDRAGDVERAADLLVHEARDALDFTIARQAEVQARAQAKLAEESHRLNQIAAMFLPMTALTSIFGMTMRSGLEGLGGTLFWGVVALGLVLGWVMRSPRPTQPASTSDSKRPDRALRRQHA